MRHELLRSEMVKVTDSVSTASFFRLRGLVVKNELRN